MSCRHCACRAVDFHPVPLPAEAVPESADLERGNTSVGTQEGCASFFWGSQIRPLVPWPGAHPAQPHHPWAEAQPGVSWAEGWGVEGYECCVCMHVCGCTDLQIYICIYIPLVPGEGHLLLLLLLCALIKLGFPIRPPFPNRLVNPPVYVVQRGAFLTFVSNIFFKKYI